MGNGKIILGVLTGLAIGGIAGILFAPEKGSRTRRKILNKSEDYFEDIKEKLYEYIESIKDKYEHVHESTENLSSK